MESKCSEKNISNGNDSNDSKQLEHNLKNETENLIKDKIKGDAIGNTLYSERFVLKTLLQLKDDDWNEELENDMCSIWDMTTEKDVVDFLQQINFINISIDIIKNSTELRLIEILVGVIGNMCVYEDSAVKTIESKDFGILLSLILSDDTPTLIQLMRLYKALLFCEKIDINLIITEDSLNQINFILSSSQNLELLEYTLQVVVEIINKSKSIKVAIEFFDNICEALTELYKNNENDYISQDLQKYILLHMKVLNSICTLIRNEYESKNISSIISKFNKSRIDESVYFIENILSLCSNLVFIQSESEPYEYIIYCISDFLILFQTSFNQKIVDEFVNNFKLIKDNNLIFETDVLGNIKKYLEYSFKNKEICNELQNIFNVLKKNENK